MAQIAKTSVKMGIQSPSAKFFDFMRYDMTKLQNSNPEIFKRIEVVEGKEGQVGSVILYEYVLGTTKVAKVKTSKIDEKERSLNFDPVEGEMLQQYPSFKTKVTASEGGVEWIIEYEKANESIPSPDHYAKFFGEVIKIVDAAVLCS